MSRAESCPLVSHPPSFHFQTMPDGCNPPLEGGRCRSTPSPMAGRHPAPSPQQGRGPALPKPPFSLFGARSWTEVTAPEEGRVKHPWVLVPSRAVCLRWELRTCLKSRRKRDLTPLLPHHASCGFGLCLIFWIAENHPRVYRRVHFTAEKIQTARINHRQERVFLLHLPICGCFIMKNLTYTQRCT